MTRRWGPLDQIVSDADFHGTEATFDEDVYATERTIPLSADARGWYVVGKRTHTGYEGPMTEIEARNRCKEIMDKRHS